MSSAMVRKVSLPSSSRPSKKRRVTRRVSISKSMRAPGTHVLTRTCSISQTYSTTGIVPQVGLVASQYFSLWFTNQSAYIWLNAANYSTVSVPGYSDLAALFDEIKIAAIEIQIIPGVDPTTSGSGSGVICMATDYNDKSAPTSLADIQQYADCKNISLSNNYIYKEVLNPRFLTYSLDSAGAAIASTPKTGFIRSNLDIEHYGKKCSFVSVPPNNSIATFVFKYKFICKIQK